jgi:hypothetical protein
MDKTQANAELVLVIPEKCGDCIVPRLEARRLAISVSIGEHTLDSAVIELTDNFTDNCEGQPVRQGQSSMGCGYVYRKRNSHT